jgi:hypothetical protein
MLRSASAPCATCLVLPLKTFSSLMLSQVNILNTLDAVGLTDKTVIVKTADHGEMGLSHGTLIQKNFNMWVAWLRLPCAAPLAWAIVWRWFSQARIRPCILEVDRSVMGRCWCCACPRAWRPPPPPCPFFVECGETRVDSRQLYVVLAEPCTLQI